MEAMEVEAMEVEAMDVVTDGGGCRGRLVDGCGDHGCGDDRGDG